MMEQHCFQYKSVLVKSSVKADLPGWPALLLAGGLRGR
jgi:hypothetical protein